MEREVIGYKSGYCPNCGAGIAEYDGNEIDGMEVHFYFSCPSCGGAGCETYLMEYDSSNCLIEEK